MSSELDRMLTPWLLVRLPISPMRAPVPWLLKLETPTRYGVAAVPELRNGFWAL